MYHLQSACKWHSPDRRKGYCLHRFYIHNNHKSDNVALQTWYICLQHCWLGLLICLTACSLFPTNCNHGTFVNVTAEIISNRHPKYIISTDVLIIKNWCALKHVLTMIVKSIHAPKGILSWQSIVWICFYTHKSIISLYIELKLIKQVPLQGQHFRQ